MQPLVTPTISFKEFKEICYVQSGQRGGGNYSIYFGKTDTEYAYKYKIRLHWATKDKALRAAYFLLFYCTDSRRDVVREGEFKVSITFGNWNSFCADGFDADKLKYEIQEAKVKQNPNSHV